MVPFAVVWNGGSGRLVLDAQSGHEDGPVRVDREGNGSARSVTVEEHHSAGGIPVELHPGLQGEVRVVGVELDLSTGIDQKSTRLNSSHRTSSYAFFCWKIKNKRGTIG